MHRGRGSCLPAPALRRRLMPLAWVVSLLLSPQASDAAEGEALGEAFRSAGWDMSIAPDGSLILSPWADGAVVAPPAQPDAKPGGSAEGAQPPQVPSTLARSLRDQIEAAGWQVHEAADGLLTLSAPQAPAQPGLAPSTRDLRDSVQSLEPPREEPSRFEALFRERGWEASRMDDGSLVLRPKRMEETAAESVEGGIGAPCPGVAVTVATEKGFDLPVDAWSEARGIAEAWLASTGARDLQIGRIRQIFGIYLVSVVERAVPHRLRHQVAIRSQDGRLMVLY